MDHIIISLSSNTMKLIRGMVVQEGQASQTMLGSTIAGTTLLE